MYKLMIVDDEGIVIDSLKFIIEKEFGDSVEIKYAKTGRGAIELAETFRPEIAVMDIQMPGINGIDAMREIRKSDQNMVFVVMSAYDKFDYAQEAIQLGAMNYLTKPMDRTKMIRILREAMEQVDSERRKRSNDLMIREKLETVMPILENGLIYNILFREHFSEDIESYRNLLEIRKDHAFMLAFVCGDEQEGNHMTNAVGSSVKLLRRYQEVREYIKEYFDCIVGTVMGNKIAVLVPYEEAKMDYSERTELIDKARELVRFLRKRTENNFRIGIGKVKPITEMLESYTEATNALVMTTGSVAHADDLPMGCDYEENYPVEYEKNLFESLEQGRTDEALSNARYFFSWMKGGDLMDVRLKVLEFTLRAEKIAYEKGGMTYRFDSRRDYLPTVMALSGDEELKEWFIGKISQVCSNIRNKQAEHSVGIIENAKEYIDSNFSKDISLEDVSQRVNISPYYFSRIFREETGQTFIEYLTGIRIERAKELLREQRYTMKEICAEIGYSDPNYFSRSFKKNVGVTPTEYKEEYTGQ